MSPDAAALPSPPDFAPWDNAPRRPQSLGGMQPGGKSIAAGLGSYQVNNSYASPAGSQPARFPNIKDLQDEAAALDLNDNTSLSVLLERAQVAIDRARELADTDQLDRAYVHYLRASEITINLIPNHPDYRATASQRPGWYKRFGELMMVCRGFPKHIECCDKS
ncbi:hypothetical protein ASPFODRAFT_41329 [Aspergillus luchuensis CBS 106.47]|uniref:USP8 dimerisation domain-containing protein n=1 Tax=Aspergillus luchuensis (strain CBS 106.47) TaxID=1137211 RepID=A0A1M3TVK6_ASPLC|nr:hypothetical protein ASPFODRAFT_41329 [Aspergillus luchuensis CBS 106.47]